jgi:transcriptional regulator of acetoin/glycerol metabolism
MSFQETQQVIVYTEDESPFKPQLDISRLEELWLQFATSQTIPSENLRPSIVDSWERCRALKVNLHVHAPAKLSPEQLEHRLSALNEYLENIEPVIARVEKLVETSKYMISFVDADGYILTTRGDPSLLSVMETLNFQVGANWSEKCAGTTAVGVALATGQPSQVFHAEHFCKELHGFTCSAVPIKDPFTKQVIGVIDFVSKVDNFQAHTMGMALQMSHCIELEIYRAKKERDDIFRECSVQLTLDELQRGVIVLDRNRNIRRMNMMALEYLKLDSSQILDKRLDDIPLFAKWRMTDRPLKIRLPDESMAKVHYKSLMKDRRLLGSLILIEPVSREDTSGNEVGSHTPCCNPVGESKEFKRVLATARSAAQYDSTVLVTGETGTGKEVLARYIHEHSSRKNKPFVAINCGSIPTELLGSELFGYDSGAFTGAKQSGHPSKFELAKGGTLLLDEISEMPPESQVYLLRVIEERMVTRLGGTKAIPMDVRIIAASNKDLKGLASKGRFREDLYFRLNVIRLSLPSLLERTGDIELLAHHFLDMLSSSLGRNFKGFSSSALLALNSYHWPGNVRELRNVIEQAMVMSSDELITYDSLPDYVGRTLQIPDHVSDSERDKYLKFYLAFKELNGNVSQVAKALNISRPTVYAWRDKFGLSQA